MTQRPELSSSSGLLQVPVLLTCCPVAPVHDIDAQIGKWCLSKGGEEGRMGQRGGQREQGRGGGGGGGGGRSNETGREGEISG